MDKKTMAILNETFYFARLVIEFAFGGPGKVLEIRKSSYGIPDEGLSWEQRIVSAYFLMLEANQSLRAKLGGE